MSKDNYDRVRAFDAYLALEIFAELPAGSRLARNANGQWRVRVSLRSDNEMWQEFTADTPYEAICDAANWYADYCRRLDAEGKA